MAYIPAFPRLAAQVPAQVPARASALASEPTSALASASALAWSFACARGPALVAGLVRAGGPACARAAGRSLAGLALFAAAASALRAAEPDVTLVMVEQPGCHYCRAWHAEIGPAYPNTAAGAFAPLRTEQMRAIPDDLDLDRRVLFTPTFVVVDAAGTELGRIEGYPGQEFFWPLLEQLLADAAGFAPPTTTPREEETR